MIETPAIYLDMSATGNLKEQYRVLGLRSFDTIPQLLKMVGLEDEAMVTGTVAFKVSLLAQSLSPGLLTIMLLYSII